jgi:ribosomal protein S19E (S16A)
MNDEFDYELTPNQWEVLKALRAPAANPSIIRRFAVERLTALGLVAMRGDSFVITPLGRKVLIRGSSRLLQDLAA